METLKCTGARAALTVGLSLAAHGASQALFGPLAPIVTVATASIYTGAALADAISTHRVAKTAREATEVGIDHCLCEKSPALPSLPTIKDFCRPQSLLAETAVQFGAIAFPPAGIPAAFARLKVTLNNEKINKELQEQIASLQKVKSNPSENPNT